MYFKIDFNFGFSLVFTWLGQRMVHRTKKRKRSSHFYIF